MAYYAGVDLGATNLRAAVGNEDGEVLSVARTSTPRGPTGIAITEAILSVLREACEEVGIAPDRLEAVGVGSIGPLDLTEGTVEDPANLPDAIDQVPITGPIGNLVDSDRVYLHNDTNAGVIGERYYSDLNPDDMAYLTISSGIGAGVAVDGHVLTGWDGNAGEIGHVTVDPEGRMECGCGIDGHWEAYCSGNNLPDYARYLARNHDVDTGLAVSDADFDAANLFGAAGEDPLADFTLERMSRWNAQGMAALVHAYAPLVVYVGGAVTLHNESLVLDPIRDRLEEMVMTNVPEMRKTNLGDDVVLRGALASALTGGTGRQER